MHRRIVLLGFAVLAACGGSDSTASNQILTSINVTLTPNGVQVGQTAIASATGVDQNGSSMPTGAVTWTSGTSNATVAQDGKVTAVAAGTAIITGTVGTKSGQASLTIVPLPAVAMTFVTPLPATYPNRIQISPAPVVQLVNALGAPVAQGGLTVSTAASVGNMAGTTTAFTDANGRATFSNLGLAGIIGPRTVVFSAPGITNLTGSINITVGPPAIGIIVAGDQQSAPAGTAVPIAPSLRVTDPDGNISSNVAMEFVVETGGGTVTGSPATTNASGIATLGSWILGTPVGTNTLLARPVGTTGGIRFTATATTPPPSGLK